MVRGATEQAPHLALSAVLSVLRDLARDGASDKDLALVAKVLDYAEYLPLLITDRDDRTADFEAVLVELVECHAPFRLALARLHGSS